MVGWAREKRWMWVVRVEAREHARDDRARRKRTGARRRVWNDGRGKRQRDLLVV